MDIYSAETQVKRLLKFVEDTKTARPKMLNKSKNRLRDLAATCADVVHIISEILQEESLNIDGDEFSTSNLDIADSVANMRFDLNKLATMAETSTPMVSGLEMVAIQNNVFGGSATRKNVMSQYAVVLKTLAKSKIAYPAVADCARLLWLWFDTRFLSNSDLDFHFNIKRIGTWIADIVILYSYAVIQNSTDEFEKSFKEWCNLIPKSETQYAIPYFVYLFDKNCDGSKLTLLAAVIWDILLDLGLRTVCADNSDIYVREDYVYKLCDKYNPDVLDRYVNYRDDPAVLSKCGLVK